MLIRFNLGLCLLMLSSFAGGQNSTITTIDVPGAVWTLSVGINSAGTIAGSYSDDIAYHGFLRDRDGNVTTYEAPGEGLIFRTPKHQPGRDDHWKLLWRAG